jgi:CRP/FNR family transcriptional regulator, cyclic AMP receptor protein
VKAPASRDDCSPVSGSALDRNYPFRIEAFAAAYGGVSRSMALGGAAIYTQGERAECLYYVEDGRAQLEVVSPEGKEAIIVVLDTGEFCGDDCLTGTSLRLTTARCVIDSAVVRLEKANLLAAIRRDPCFADFYLAYVLHRNDLLKRSLISHLADSSECRLARILLQLANCRTDARENGVIDHVDQEALAQMVGTTRSRVNYFMNKFRGLGHIEYSGQIVVYGSLSSVLEVPSSE